MTTYTFADRYSEASLAPTAEKILLREGPVKQLVENAEDQQIVALTQFYYGHSEIDLTWFRNAFVEADASFSMVNNEREARVLSALVLGGLIKKNNTTAILAVSTGSVRGQRIPPQSSWLVCDAQKTFLTCSVKNRTYQSIPCDISTTYTRNLAEELAAAIETPELATLPSLVSKVRDELRSSTQTMSQKISAALEECEHQLSLMREESQMLWWLTGGHSNILSRSFASFSPSQAAFIGALDLGKLTTYTDLGPVAIPAMLDKIITLAKKQRTQGTVSLSSLIDSFGSGDIEALDSSQTLPAYIAPFSSAINLAKTMGNGVWHARFEQNTGLKSSLMLDPVSTAEQLYREYLLGRLM